MKESNYAEDLNKKTLEAQSKVKMGGDEALGASMDLAKLRDEAYNSGELREEAKEEWKIKLEQQEQEEVNRKVEEFKLEIEEALKNNDFDRVSQLTQSAKDTAESIEKRKEKELFIKELSDEIKKGEFGKKFIEYMGGYSMVENSDSFKKVTPKYSSERLNLSKDEISDIAFKLLIDKYSLPTYLLIGQANTNRTDQWDEVGSFLSKIGFSAQENKEAVEKAWNNILAERNAHIAVGLGRLLNKYDTQDFYLNKDVIKNWTVENEGFYLKAGFMDKNGKGISKENILKIIKDSNQDLKARVDTWTWHTTDLNTIQYKLNIEDTKK